jgi:hypothetical protein
VAGLVEDEEEGRDYGKQEKPADPKGEEPQLRQALQPLDTQHQAAEGEGHQKPAHQVQDGSPLGFGQGGAEKEQDPDQADGHVDPEDPVPGGPLHDEAAQVGAQHVPQGEDPQDLPQVGSPLFLGHGGPHDGLGHRKEPPCAHGLDNPGHDEGLQVGGEGGQSATPGEKGHGGPVDAPIAPKVGEPPQDGQGHSVEDGVDGKGQGDPIHARAQVFGDGGEGGGEDGVVQGAHEDAQEEGEEQAAVHGFTSKRLGEGGVGSSLRYSTVERTFPEGESTW